MKKCIKTLMGVVLWFIYMPFYINFLLLGWSLSFMVVLSTMWYLENVYDDNGTKYLKSSRIYPKWAYLWSPINEEQYLDDQKIVGFTTLGIWHMFSKRLKTFLKPKDTVLNTRLLGRSVFMNDNTFRVPVEDYSILHKRKHNLTLRTLSSSETFLWRLTLHFKRKKLLDLGWQLQLDKSHEVYNARYLFKILTD